MNCDFLSKKDQEYFKGKTVFFRAGLNVPIVNNRIENDFRLRALLPSLRFLLNAGARLVVAGHLGRDENEKLDLIFDWFKKELKKEKVKVIFNSNTFFQKNNDQIEEDIKKALKDLNNGELLLLDNLRATQEEKNNSEDLGKKMAEIFDIYINEAFSVSHRKHMSMNALPELFQEDNCFYGFRFEEELKNLELIKNPQSFKKKIFILGGAKIATKIPMIEKLLDKFDLIILGGAVANNFFLEMGYPIGNSFYDKDFIFKQSDFEKIMKSGKVFLPEWVITETGQKKVCDILPAEKILDISPKSFKRIEKELKEADFVFFNGPMGFYEGDYKEGTEYLLKVLANPNNFFVAGGGDTAAAIFELGLEKNVDFISTGGGALIKKISE